VDGSGSYMHADKMANVAKAPPSLGIAMTKGLRAMWAAHRANLSSGEIVEQALEAVNQAGGTPTVREDVAAIASDPETFAQEEIFANYEKAGDEAATKAETAGFPEPLTAVVAARAAADALKAGPGNVDIDMELNAAKTAAERVVTRAHLNAADAADEAAMEEMQHMQDLGAYGQDVVNAARKAAIRTATKKGASHGEIDVISADAEAKVKKMQAQKAGWSSSDKMWNTRVYWGADKREVERAAGPKVPEDPEDKSTWSADGDYDYAQAMPFQ